MLRICEAALLMERAPDMTPWTIALESCNDDLVSSADLCRADRRETRSEMQQALILRLLAESLRLPTPPAAASPQDKRVCGRPIRIPLAVAVFNGSSKCLPDADRNTRQVARSSSVRVLSDGPVSRERTTSVRAYAPTRLAITSCTDSDKAVSVQQKNSAALSSGST